MSEQDNNNVMHHLLDDVRYIKANMVTYREYDHLHNEFHNTKAVVDKLVESKNKAQWLVALGEKAVWVVLGGVLVAILKLIGVT